MLGCFWPLSYRFETRTFNHIWRSTPAFMVLVCSSKVKCHITVAYSAICSFKLLRGLRSLQTELNSHFFCYILPRKDVHCGHESRAYRQMTAYMRFAYLFNAFALPLTRMHAIFYMHRLFVNFLSSNISSVPPLILRRKSCGLI